MKNLLLLSLLLIFGISFGQKITLKPDMIVGETDFDILDTWSEPKFNDNHKANVIFDRYSKESIEVFVGVRGFCIWGLILTFKNDSIIPKYYRWNDGGGHITELSFDSFELKINTNTPKIGERLKGKFKGIIKVIKEDGKVVTHKLSGKFTHVMENTPEKEKYKRAIEIANLSKKTYLRTGLYRLMDETYAMEIKAPTYTVTNTDEEYYLYNSFVIQGFAMFTKVIVEPDKQNPKFFNLKFFMDKESLHQESTLSVTDQGAFHEDFGLVVDDALLYAGRGELKIINGSVILPVNIKSKKEVESIVQKLNAAIQKDKKALNTLQKNKVQGG